MVHQTFYKAKWQLSRKILWNTPEKECCLNNVPGFRPASTSKRISSLVLPRKFSEKFRKQLIEDVFGCNFLSKVMMNLDWQPFSIWANWMDHFEIYANTSLTCNSCENVFCTKLYFLLREFESIFLDCWNIESTLRT